MASQSRDPRQKVSAALFFLLSFVFILIAALASKNRIVSEVFLNVGVAIGSVVLIAVLWRFVGGQPFEDAVTKLQQSSDTAAQIAASGIVQIHPERLLGLDERVRALAKRAAHAREIDLLGLTLYRNWFQHPELCDVLVKVLKSNHGAVRIVLVDHERAYPAYSDRLAQPGESKAPKLLDGLVDATYSELQRIVRSLNSRERQKLHIRHPNNTIIYQTIIRVDDYMFISPYVACAVGDNGFGLELLGREHTLFSLYMEEFETMFSNSLVTDLTAISRNLPKKQVGDE
jgi:hypothetical protein